MSGFSKISRRKGYEYITYTLEELYFRVGYKQTFQAIWENNRSALEAACDDDGHGWGDTHLVTFDGLAYDFQGVGEFIMVRSLSDSLEVQARMKPWRGSRVVSVQNAVAMDVAGDRVGVYVDRTPALYVNGVPTELGAEGMSLASGGAVVARPGFFDVSWPDGGRAEINTLGSYLNLKIWLPQDQQGLVEGLLGELRRLARGRTRDSATALPSPQTPACKNFILNMESRGV